MNIIIAAAVAAVAAILGLIILGLRMLVVDTIRQLMHPNVGLWRPSHRL